MQDNSTQNRRKQTNLEREPSSILEVTPPPHGCCGAKKPFPAASTISISSSYTTIYHDNAAAHSSRSNKRSTFSVAGEVELRSQQVSIQQQRPARRILYLNMKDGSSSALYRSCFPALVLHPRAVSRLLVFLTDSHRSFSCSL